MRHLPVAAANLPRVHHRRTYQQYFETPEQFDEYCEAIGRPSHVKGQKRRRGIRSPKPVGLPMF
ncbi:MAG: hypothetical protein ACR2FY_00785 [Pirellulaceae bacterium]